MNEIRPKVEDGTIFDKNEARNFARDYVTGVWNDGAEVENFSEEDMDKIFDKIDDNQEFFLLEQAADTCFICEWTQQHEDKCELIESFYYDMTGDPEWKDCCTGIEYAKVDGFDVIFLGNNFGDDSSAALVAVEYNEGAHEYDEDTWDWNA